MTLQGFSLEGIAPMVKGFGCGDGTCSVLRLTAAGGAKLPATVGVSGLRLRDGAVKMRLTDLDTGKETLSSVQVKNGVLVKPLKVGLKDVTVVLTAGK